MQFGRFAHTLSFINACINQTILKTSDFYSTDLEYKVNPSVFKNVLDHNEKIVYSEIAKHNISDYEQRLLYFITNGMTNQIKSVWVDVLKHNSLPISTNLIRHTKNECISGVSLFCRAAINGGLDSETAYELRDIYIDQIEKTNDVTALANLRYNMLIDFCERVRALQFKLTDNPAINRAINYIIEHVEKKITVTELAKLINMNGAYFSIKFKEVVKMPLIDFIHMQKVSEAKRLLKFSTKSLVEISTYLSFSSQSYFQKVFKKFACSTPKEYRNNKEI